MRYSALLMLKLTPQFRHLASTLPCLGIDDIMSLPLSITYPDEIIKSGNAPAQGIFNIEYEHLNCIGMRSDNLQM
jgi:hypothetical protein